MFYCQKCRCKHKPCYRVEKPECEKECPEYKPENSWCEKECPQYHDNIVVRDETVYCTEEETFHHGVKHIVPVVCKKVENHIYHHHYEVQKCHEREEKCYEVGKRNENWCNYCKCGRKKYNDYQYNNAEYNAEEYKYDEYEGY